MSKKREQLVTTALDLFYYQGVHEIGINEILKVSGVAKRTMYSHFESKDALIVATLQKRHTNFMSWLKDVLKDARSDQQVINLLFDGLESWFTNKSEVLGKFRGCFFINTAAEFSAIQSDIVKYCSFHKTEVRALIEQKLTCNSSTLLDAICIMKEGAITTVHMTGEGSDVCEKSKRILTSLIEPKL